MSGSVSIEKRVRGSFQDQAHWCGKLGSPFMEKLMTGLGERIDSSTATGEKILSWQGEPDATGDAVALRLAGGLHALVRSGELPDLEPFYRPDTEVLADELVDAALEAIRLKDSELLGWLDFAPQTNEVRRAAIIYAGLLEFSTRMYAPLPNPVPIALYELGASGGLNLSLAEFEYNLRNVSFGKSGSPVSLSPEWRGLLPSSALFQIVSKRGCDLNPLLVEQPEDRTRLMAYLWPDQAERLTRTGAAIDIALSDLPRLEKASADDWVEKTLEEQIEPGVARVFFHTIAWQYFPEDTKARIRLSMERHGARATNQNPLAWLSFEMVSNNAPELVLQCWPDGKKYRLAGANSHVDWIEWFN